MRYLKLTLILCFLSTALFSQISLNEKEALLDLYASTNGENWNNSWDLNKPTTEWQGLTIEDNKVIGINMLFNNIEGTLPNTIDQLEFLQELKLSFNKISGVLPTEIGNLKHLITLELNGNDLTGEIPASIGNLSSLTQLHLSSNNLSGELPESITKLKNLEVLNVFDNDLSGRIPSDLAYAINLKELMVAENNFELSNEFSSIVLSNSASVKLKGTTMIQDSKQIIANETEEEN